MEISPPLLTGATVLTLDDDESNRALLSEHLQHRGFKVLQAGAGASALEQCRKQAPDVVLLDMDLPDMDGFEVLETLKREAPELPVVVVSVSNELSEAVKAFKLGAWDYITKPIDNMAVVEHAIQQTLERAQLLRKNREYREYLEQSNKRLERSLLQLKEDEEAGRRLQFQLLPPNNLSFGDYHFRHQLWTSLYLSGDFVDYFEIDSQHIGFYMADVSGHGVSSAFVTVLLKSYMNRYLELYRQGKSNGILDPAKILTRLNRNVLNSNTNKYLTMFYGIINKSNNQMYYSNGGQFPYPVIYDGDSATSIECKSKPIGLFEFAEHHADTYQLPQCFSMALISDGILDALPQKSLKDKRAHLIGLLERTGLDNDTFTEQLDSQISGSLPDDITLLLIRKREKVK